MSLLAPIALVGLIALPLIILLHMRHTTPRTKPVPTLRFWLAAEPAPIHDTRLRRPPITLPLILQLLVVAALALALAQPAASRALAVLGLTSANGPVHLILLLDGSTSMSARDPGEPRTRYEIARDAAGGRLAALREGDVATLVVLGTRATTHGATDVASLALLRQRLRTLPAPGGRADLTAGLRLTHSLLLPNRENRIVLFTDGALSTDRQQAEATAASIELVTIGDGGSPNIAVVDLVARADPVNPTLFELYARLMNFTPEAVTLPVVLTADGLPIDRQTVTIPANGGETELIWPLPAGARQATVTLEQEDYLAADNSAAVILRQGEEQALAQRILLIADAPDALFRVLTALPGAQVTVEPAAGADAALAGAPYDLIVFAGTAPTPAQLANVQTPLLIVGPPASELLPADGVMTTPSIAVLQAHDPLLTGVDLAGVTFGPTPRFTFPAEAVVVGADAGPLIARATLGQSPALVFSFDLAQSNLSRRVAFPILVSNAVQELAPSALPSAVPLGDPLRYRPRAAAATLEVIPPAGAVVPLAVATATTNPRAREVSFADTGQPGIYTITEVAENGIALGSGRFIVNAGQAQESDLRPDPALPATLALVRPATAQSAAAPGLVSLWPLVVAATLLLVLIEAVVALLPRWRGASYVSMTPSR